MDIDGTNKSCSSDIWVFIEQADNKPKEVSCELLGQARRLAAQMKLTVAAVVIGHGVNQVAREAIAFGADKIFLVDGPEYEHYSTDAFSAVCTKLIYTYKPAVFLLGSTEVGRDLAPRVACRVKTGLIADCTGIYFAADDKQLIWTRPAYGEAVVAEVVCPERRPQMGTVRPQVFELPVRDACRLGEIIQVDSPVRFNEIRTLIVKTLEEQFRNNSLKEADIVVAGGRGVGNVKQFLLIETLAKKLGGVVGASRAAVDEGWSDPACQIGQTGQIIKPKLYIACGISGSVHHLAGIAAAKTVVAINKDPKAPIFKRAHYGIVGEVEQVIPALIEQLS
jgi:electron transfer flavoprotein alpha subunit